LCYGKGFLDFVFLRLDKGQRAFASDSLNTADAGCDATFGDYLEETDVAGAAHMRAATEFSREIAHLHHADFIAVLLAKERHRAGLDRIVVTHIGNGHRLVVHDNVVDERFDLGDFFACDRFRMREVETGALPGHQRAFLFDVRAQHFAQCGVQKVSSGVIARGGGALLQIDCGGDGVAHLQTAARQLTLMAKDVGLDLLGVGHVKEGIDPAGGEDFACVAGLAARFGVERGVIEHDHAFVAGVELL